MRCFSTLCTATSRMVLISVVLLVGGCDRFNIAAFQPDLNTYGAEPILDPQSLQQIDLAKLLYANSPGLTPVGINDQKKALKDAKNQDVLKRAFDEFAVSGTLTKRTRIQERIIAASDQRCEAYFKYLKRFDVQTNVFFNSVTTLLGGLGAIFTGADTVRALSGSAAIFSGWGAVSNDAFFQELTVQVVTNGIKLRRTDIHADMVRKRNFELASYPAEAAVRDAIRYHASCSLVAGLERAALELDRAEDPGVRQMQRTLFEAKRLQLIADLPPEELLSKDLQENLARSFPSISPEAVAGKVNEVPTDVWHRELTRIQRAENLVGGALSAHETDINSKHAEKEINDAAKAAALDKINAIRKQFGADYKQGIRNTVRALFKALNADKQNEGKRYLTLSNEIEEQADKFRRSDAKARKIERTILETMRSDAERTFNRPLREIAMAYAGILGEANQHLADGKLDDAKETLDEEVARKALCKVYVGVTEGKSESKNAPEVCKKDKPAAPAAPAAAKNTEPDKDAKRLTPPFVRLGSFPTAAGGDETKAMAGAVERREQARAIKGLIPDSATLQAWKPDNIWVVDLGPFKTKKEADDFCENPLLDQMKDGFKKANDCGVKTE